MKQNTTNIQSSWYHYINISDSQTITLPLILELNPELVEFITPHTPANPRGASKMITVRLRESIKRMKEAGKFPPRWCQQRRAPIFAIFWASFAAAPLECQRRSPRAPPAELCDHRNPSQRSLGTRNIPASLKGVIQIYSSEANACSQKSLRTH